MNGTCRTCFNCEAGGQGYTVPEAEAGARKTHGGLSWLVIGDYGYKLSAGEKEVAQKMNEIASKEKINFVINTGDNFYDP